jgi:hypothetical protein
VWWLLLLLLWSRVYNRPVYFSISTPPSNWLIKQSYLAGERAARKRHAAAAAAAAC